MCGKGGQGVHINALSPSQRAYANQQGSINKSTTSKNVTCTRGTARRACRASCRHRRYRKPDASCPAGRHGQPCANAMDKSTCLIDAPNGQGRSVPPRVLSGTNRDQKQAQASSGTPEHCGDAPPLYHRVSHRRQSSTPHDTQHRVHQSICMHKHHPPLHRHTHSRRPPTACRLPRTFLSPHPCPIHRLRSHVSEKH